MNTTIKIKGDFRCQRLRMLAYLVDHGFQPKNRMIDFHESQPDKIRYYWNFETTDELLEALNKYNGCNYIRY